MKLVGGAAYTIKMPKEINRVFCGVMSDKWHRVFVFFDDDDTMGPCFYPVDAELRCRTDQYPFYFTDYATDELLDGFEAEEFDGEIILGE